MHIVKKYFPVLLVLICSAVFLSSIPFKFGNAPETITIFQVKLDGWAASLGAPGLFAQSGLFSQYVIGTAEILASLCMLIGILPRFVRLQGFGALLGLAVMTGAISFHLFTPLGIDPNNDGGGLFVMACVVWLSCATLVFMRRDEIKYGLCRIVEGLFGAPSK